MNQDIELLMQEYNTIRTECTDTIKTRNQIISYGLGTVGVIIGGTLTLIDKDGVGQNKILVLIILNYFIPIICVLILFIWLGEVKRMMRAGHHLIIIENRVNERIEPELLTWETKEEQTRYKQKKLMVLQFYFLYLWQQPVQL